MALLVCPFCREVFPSSERDTCPDCGIELRAEDAPTVPKWADEEAPDDPWTRPLPWYSPAAGRGPVFVLAVAVLGLFFAPWLVIRVPAEYVFSGLDLAMTRGFWFSGGAISCLVLLALVLSRRNRLQLRGVRAIATLLASVTAWQTLFVLALAGTTPVGGHTTHAFSLGFYLSALTSILAALAASRLGGNPPPPTEDPPTSPPPEPTLH